MEINFRDNINLLVSPKQRELQTFDNDLLLQSPLPIFGKGVNYSEMEAANEMANNYGLVYELLRNRIMLRDMEFRSDGEGGYEFKINGKWNTTPFSNYVGDACCWAAPELAGCYDYFKPDYLCLKDCSSRVNSILEDIIHAKSYDVQTPWTRINESIAADKRRLNIAAFEWLIAMSIIQGQQGVTTGIHKSFLGLMQYMSNELVLALSGSDPLAALEQLACRVDMFLGGGNFVIATHPLTMESFLTQYRKVRDMADAPLVMRNNELYFRTPRGREVRFVADQFIPFDQRTQTGEAWLVDLSDVRLTLAFDMLNPLITDDSTNNQVVADGCFVDCETYQNLGAVIATDYNRMAKIINIPIASQCADVLQNMGQILFPDTLIPAQYPVSA